MDLPESVAAIASRSRFDHLHLTGEQYTGRYGSVYEALAGMGSNQQDISLRVFDLPEEQVNEFSELITERIGEFAPETDHDSLVTVHDYGERPRPWVATATISERLSSQRPMDFVSPLSVATDVVDGILHLHQNDLTHGGLDPRSVVFVGDRFDDVPRGDPLIDNAGLLGIFRYYFEPSSYLEPAYAAPEYYSTDFGSVDHQTDIYQLGAVLYYLVTGESPYSGTLDEIQRAVQQGSPPTPSRAGAPSEFDDVLTKAMATEKIKRYETVQYLKADLERIVANRDHEWVDGA